MGPIASLIIATYNHARHLPAALESALGQTLEQAEVIVIDDGSTDDTPAILARHGNRIRCRRQPNRGLAAARNAGLAMARGAYVAFLDADDLVQPTKLAEQVAILEAAPQIGWTYCDVRIEDKVTGAIINVSERFAYSRRRLDGRLFPELVQGNFIPVMAPLARRSALDAAGWFDETLTSLEDWDLWLRLSLVADAHYIPRPLAVYRIWHGGMSQDRAGMDRNRFLVLDKASRTHPSAIRALGLTGRRIIADTHNWFGYEAYSRADWCEATRRLAASVRSIPWQRRAPILLALSLLRRCLA